MELKFKDVDTNVIISSDLLNDNIVIDMTDEDDGNECTIFINRKDSLELANEIIEFWKNNPKISF